MAAQIFTPANRLADTITGRDAPTMAELTLAAEGRAADLGDSIRAFLDEKVHQILRFSDASEETLFADCQTLGDDARHVAEVAGAAGRDVTGEICLGISAMIDALTRQGVWHSDALRVHLYALSIAAQSKTDDEPGTILERLKLMRSTLGISD